MDFFLDLEFIPPSMLTPVLTPSLGGFLSPTSTASLSVNIGQPMFVSTIPMELLNKVTTGGVAVNYRFTHHPHLYAQGCFFLNTFIVHIHLLYIVVYSQVTVFPHPQPYLSSHSPLT